MTRRQWAAALCGLFALILALSGLMVMAHLGHSCLGEDCPLCAALSHWELLRGWGRWRRWSAWPCPGQRRPKRFRRCVERPGSPSVWCLWGSSFRIDGYIPS